MLCKNICAREKVALAKVKVKRRHHDQNVGGLRRLGVRNGDPTRKRNQTVTTITISSEQGD